MNKFVVRKLIQNIFLGLWVIIILAAIAGKLNTVHQFCPHSLVCFGPMYFKGHFAYIPMVIIGLLVAISTIFVGRKFCGYICFLGTIQEYLFKMNTFKNKNRIPHKLHKMLGIIKYIFLIIILYLVLDFSHYVFMKFCPIQMLSFPGSITIYGLIILLILFIGGFFIERFWCRYLCPYAALMNIFQFIGKLLRIKRQMISRNWEICVDCYICNKNCPMNIDISKYEDITDPNCIHCLKCIKVCPKEKCLTFK